MSAGPFAAHFQPGWLEFSITVEPFTGQFNSYGQPQHGAAQTMKCYIEDRVRMVRDTQGNERVSNSTLFIAGGPIDARDRITLPPTYKGPLQPPILSVSNVNDRIGFDHAEVYL